MTKRNPEKVIITISNLNYRGEKNKFRLGCEKKGIKEFTSVDYSASTYGAASPCVDSEEINEAIEGAKETIIHYGDIPIINDMRVKKVLTDWF